jgi:adenylate cyclase
LVTVILVPLNQRTSASNRGERFDPGRIPLLNSAERAALADYSRKPDYKALAISAAGAYAAVEAPDIESAKTEALQKCGLQRDSACTLYAVGMDVVWPHGLVPVPPAADQRTEPLSSKFTPTELARIYGSPQSWAEGYAARRDHRALAISPKRHTWIANLPSRDEAARLAIERCGYGGQLPCLLISVDGFWTVEIPASRRVIGAFLPTIATELPSDERQRIGGIYQGQPWRALVRGGKGTWHAVAGAPSEADAVANALQSCGKVDTDCQLFAIGNFRVAQD